MVAPVAPVKLDTPTLRLLQPVPSQQLRVAHEKEQFDVILDSSATVSFCTSTLVKRLNLVIRPNSQLALLVDQRYRVESKGEVDFLVVELTMSKALLRIRALVLDNLTANCYAGQTFHLDNGVTGDVSAGCVHLHGQRYVVTQAKTGVGNQFLHQRSMCTTFPPCGAQRQRY